MKIHLASSGITLPSFINASCQTPENSKGKTDDEEEEERHSSSMSSLEVVRESVLGSRIMITKPSPYVEDSMDEPEDGQEHSGSSRKRKKKVRASHSAVSGNEEVDHEQSRGTGHDSGDEAMQRLISSKKNGKMENKACDV